MRSKRRNDERARERAELEIELRTAASVFAASPRGALVSFGAPTRCPACSTFGMVDSVSEYHGIARNHCMSCGEHWVLTRRAIEHLEWLTAQVPDHIQTDVAARSLATSEFVLADDTTTTDEGAAAPIGSAATTTWVGAIRLLLVEPDPFDVAMIETLIEPLGDKVAFVQAATIEAARRPLARGIDVVLLGARTVAGAGSATMAAWVQLVGGHAPVILLTDTADSTATELAHVLGASQVVDHAQLGRLADDPGAGSKRLLQFLTITVKKHRTDEGVNLAW